MTDTALAPEADGKPTAFLDTQPGLLISRVAVFAVVLLGWYLASGPLVEPFWISDPLAILSQLAKWFSTGEIWPHLLATLETAALGYLIGTVLGVGAGLLLGTLPRVEMVLSPFLVALFSLPKIALLPILIILFGIGLASKIALVAIVVLFLAMYATIDGVRDVDRDLIDALKVMGARRREILWKTVLPSTLPWIYNGMRLSVSYAMTTTVIGELLSSNRGLGYLIEFSASSFNATGVFAAVLILVVLSVLTTAAINRIEKHLMRWRQKTIL